LEYLTGCHCLQSQALDRNAGNLFAQMLIRWLESWVYYLR
jgi:hypothetical protein